MKRELAIAILLAALGAAAALASPMIPTSQPPGPMMPTLGGPMIPGFVSGGGGGAGNDLLLEDGASNLLLEDGSSKLCLESGC
jgi:hypothetical protein